MNIVLYVLHVGCFDLEIMLNASRSMNQTLLIWSRLILFLTKS